jgi:hypothetical protein
MTDKTPGEQGTEPSAADRLEQELLDAMRDLRRKNRKVEEYLDGIARPAEISPQDIPQEGSDSPEE